MKRSIRAATMASASALVLASPWLAPSALAACITAGTVTTCSGISGGGAVGFAVASDGNTVINLGTLSGTIALQMNGDSNTAVNDGTITGTQGIVVVNDGTFSTNGNIVTNNGTIAAVTQGISMEGDNDTAVNNGIITAAQGGGIAVMGASTLVVNNGTITSVSADGAFVGAAVDSTGIGTVINNGTLNGAVSVGGTLTNTGLIMISASGAGVTHSAGIFQQTPTGVLQLRSDAAGNHDTLGVDGAATLTGTLQLGLQPGLYGNTTVYTGMVLAAGFGSTQFAAVTVPSPFFAVSTAYVPAGPARVDVTLTRIPFGTVPGLTDNQRSIGDGLESGYSTTVTGAAATIYSNLLIATSVNVLDGLSGEIGTAVQNPSFTLGEQFLDAMLGQPRRRRDEQCGTPSSAGAGRPPQRWGAWIAGLGQSGHRDGDAGVGSARLNSSNGGGAAGVDVCVAPNLVVGIAVGGAASDFSLDGRGASGDARSVFFGTYGSWTFGPLYVDLGLAYGNNQYSTTRSASLNAINERATGDFSGNQFASRLETGWRFTIGGYELTPFVGVSAQVLHQSGFNEATTNTATGQPGILGLSYRGATTDAPLPYLGGQAATTYRFGELVTVSPRLRLSWGRETSTGRQASGSFQSIPGASFTVNGARAARNAVNLRLGVDAEIAGLVELYARVDSALSSGGSGFAAAAGVRMAW